ncbi:MAG: ABC transporter permease subunit [Actinobacteria bacterium]|nr:ABC transporter permease subunit [Actinomycetota bacterium]
MNVFIHEMKQNRNATIAWIIALIAVAGFYTSVYPAVAHNAAISDVYKNFPEAFKKTFDISENTLNAFSGFYGLVLNLVLLTGALQAMNLGTGIASKEMRERTADFLLTRPISRASILRQKLLTVLALIVITDLVFLAVDWGLIKLIVNEPFAFKTFIVSTISLWLVQLFFLSFGFLLGSVMKRIKSVIAISLPAVFGFYVIGLFDTVVGEKIKFLTPFKFFDVNNLAAGGSYETVTLIYLSVLTIAAVVTSFVVFQKNDIPTL